MSASDITQPVIYKVKNSPTGGNASSQHTSQNSAK